jgi:hypothetical protein
MRTQVEIRTKAYIGTITANQKTHHHNLMLIFPPIEHLRLRAHKKLKCIALANHSYSTKS